MPITAPGSNEHCRCLPRALPGAKEHLGKNLGTTESWGGGEPVFLAKNWTCDRNSSNRGRKGPGWGGTEVHPPNQEPASINAPGTQLSPPGCSSSRPRPGSQWPLPQQRADCNFPRHPRPPQKWEDETHHFLSHQVSWSLLM